MMISHLLKAVRSGFLMAGLMTCGCASNAVDDAGSRNDTGSTADVVSNPPVLPGDRELTCPGPHYGDAGRSYSGSCCEHVVCRARVDGGCPVGNDGQFYGSGRCLCGATPQIDGPFTIADDDPRFAVERQAGPCCYVTKSVSCVGRPLLVADGVRVAPVVVRGDWC